MRSRRGGEFETYHLTCPVCGALPGTSCIEDFQELERVHPSRRMSVAERNLRRADSGWEPPELAERRPGKREAGAALTPPAVPGTRVRPGGRSPRAAGPAPRRGPGSGAGPKQAAAGPAGQGRQAEAPADAADPGADEEARRWFAAYLARWPHPQERSRPLGPARQEQRRRADGTGSSRGSRSAHHLSVQLRALEKLGLIRRDTRLDAVIVTDPAGLRRFSLSPSCPPGAQHSGSRGDG